MEPEIIHTKAKKLVGMTMEMSFTDNKTSELWRSFMPRKNEIKHTRNENLISLQNYDPNFFQRFDPNKSFRKWCLREVESFDLIPDGMVTFELPEGQYAVFTYRGLPAKAKPFFDYIFRQWLPDSGYKLDDRAHFEVLGSKYRNNSPDSEEEVWIPVRKT